MEAEAEAEAKKIFWMEAEAEAEAKKIFWMEAEAEAEAKKILKMEAEAEAVQKFGASTSLVFTFARTISYVPASANHRQLFTVLK